MLDTDERIVKFFLVFGLILALGAMTLGPLDTRSQSIAHGVTVSLVVLVGMFLILRSWSEPDDVSKEQTPVMMIPMGQFTPMAQPHDDDANGETTDEVEEFEQPVG